VHDDDSRLGAERAREDRLNKISESSIFTEKFGFIAECSVDVVRTFARVAQYKIYAL
jgi:hypothetical protein